MSTWILTISLGPVGGFIAAGRRSRDLWWGSTWVSQATRCVADAIEREGCNTGVTILLPTNTARKILATRHGGLVANKLVVQVEGDSKRCLELAKCARAAATKWLADQVGKGLDEASKRGELLLDPAQRDAQLEALRAGDFLELRAGWAELDPDDWKGSMKQATALRDATPRLFELPALDLGVYKCDLDPGRPSVLQRFDPRTAPEKHQTQLRQRIALGLSEGEELDALYLARRLARFFSQYGEDGRQDEEACKLGSLPFPPVGRIAAEPWLEGAHRARPTWIAALRTELDRLAKGDGFAAWCSRSRCPTGGTDLPFDPAALFEGGVEALLGVVELAGLKASELGQVPEIVRELHRERKPPIPYYALVELDGDGVGHALSGLDMASWMKAISALDGFARDAASEVEARQGVPFYAAGDELLFYAPLDEALGTVKRLQQLWVDAAASTPGLESTTLSAAVCFVHVKDDLDAARARVSKALKDAKKRKKALKCPQAWLALVDMPRAGSERALVGPAEERVDALKFWRDDALANGEDALSLRTAHILWEHARRLAIPGDTGSPGLRLAQGAVLKQLERSERRSDGPARAELALRVRALKTGESLRDLVHELLIAERVARVSAQRGEEGVRHGDR